MVKKLFLLIIMVITVGSFVPTQTAYSQGEIEIQCGQIIENEFTSNAQDHIYVLEMEPRESFNVSLQPFGDFLDAVVVIYGPSGIRLDGTDNGRRDGRFSVSKSPSIASGILSARGSYKIRVANTAISGSNDDLYNDSDHFGGVGLYTLSIGCTISDGTKIEPGDIVQPTPTPVPILTATAQTAQTTQTSPTSEFSSESTFSFLTTGHSYEITFGSQTKVVKLIELTNEGWAKIEVNGGTGWLNLYQVALIIPLD